MNSVTLVGRLTKDPTINTSSTGVSIARYTLAVDRRTRKEGEQAADFIPCVAFDRAADFAGKWFTKGMRVAVSGRLQTGSYTNREGVKVYTTDVIVSEQEFAQSKNEAGAAPAPTPADNDGFLDSVDDAGLPWNT